MKISNIVFEHLNKCESILNLLDSKIRESEIKQISLKELKNKISSPKIDFSLYLNREIINFIDDSKSKEVFLENPVVILTLNREQTHKVLKRYYFEYQNNILGKDLIDHLEEQFSFLLFNESSFYVASKILKDEDLVDYIELSDLEIEERMKILNNKEIFELINKNPDLLSLKKINLILSENCNLQCSYCYEPLKNKKTMTLETAKKVLRKFPNGSLIRFFGGEPFLHIDLMKQIMNWGYEFKNFDFEISTNGQIIDREFFKMYCKDIKYLQISVDGPEHVHDANRGKDSWKKSMEFYEVFYEETGWYPALFRVISKSSIPYLFETIKWFYNIGIKAINTQSSRNIIEDYLLTPWRGTFSDFKLLEENDFIELEKQWTMVKNWYLEKEIYKTPWSILAFNQAEKKYIKSEQIFIPKLLSERLLCPAGKQAIYVRQDGDIVSCLQDYNSLDIKHSLKLEEDFDKISTLGMIRFEDIHDCADCEGFGCLHCTGSHRKNDLNWCRANKILVNISKKYISELKQKLCI